MAGGGRYGAGILERVSVITRGEALGHGMWVDEVMLEQVEYAMDNTEGTKSRFTHPGMSSDGMGKHLGRIYEGERDGDRVVGDLHFAKSALLTPDGNLVDYVSQLAKEDPKAAGLSIVFDRDPEMELDFMLAHGAEISDETGRLLLDNFQSPDPKNTQNLPHARLARLRAADVVDEPAANPGGMFQRQAEPAAADAFLAYIFEQSDEKPEALFGVDAERAKQFLARWQERNGLSQPEKVEDMPNDTQPDTTPAPTREELRAELQAEQQRYTERFGAERGLEMYNGNGSYEECLEQYVDELKESNKELLQKVDELENALAEVKLGEVEAVDTYGAEGKKDFRSFFGRSTAPSSN